MVLCCSCAVAYVHLACRCEAFAVVVVVMMVDSRKAEIAGCFVVAVGNVVFMRVGPAATRH